MCRARLTDELWRANDRLVARYQQRFRHKTDFRLSAVEGGLLLSKTTRSSHPLEIAIDMAIDHVARQTTTS
jgi:hypothetical protein